MNKRKTKRIYRYDGISLSCTYNPTSGSINIYTAILKHKGDEVVVAKQCVICQDIFIPTNTKQIYCKQCKKFSHLHINKSNPEILVAVSCVACGEITPSHNHNKKYCYKCIAKQTHRTPCIDCGTFCYGTRCYDCYLKQFKHRVIKTPYGRDAMIQQKAHEWYSKKVNGYLDWHYGIEKFKGHNINGGI